MIEGILKKRPGTFTYGAIDAVYEPLQQVRVLLQSGVRIRVRTSLSLRVGDAVIVAENDQDKSKFIVQYSRKAIPSQGTILLV